MAVATLNVNKQSVRSKATRNVIETPIGLRKLGEWSDNREFSGFKEERSNMRRIVTVEGEISSLRDLILGILENQDKLMEETMN